MKIIQGKREFVTRNRFVYYGDTNETLVASKAAGFDWEALLFYESGRRCIFSKERH